MSLSEIKSAVDTLSPAELAELAAFIRQREDAIARAAAAIPTARE